MIRTVATPQSSDFMITIPIDYIGKEIEILYYPTVEIRQQQVEGEKKQIPLKLSDKYRGVFSKEDAKSFNDHNQKLRKEWDNI
jgi:hypothetical protein